MDYKDIRFFIIIMKVDVSIVECMMFFFICQNSNHLKVYFTVLGRLHVGGGPYICIRMIVN
jgi:hypothetical protein